MNTLFNLSGLKLKPYLTLLDLKVSVTNPDGHRATQEGDSLNLTCTNSCDGGNLSSAFTWFKNGEHINEGSILYLSNMSSENSGNYICSLKTHTGATSGAIYIDVECKWTQVQHFYII